MISLSDKEYYLISPKDIGKTTGRQATLEIVGNAAKGISKPVIVLVDGKTRAFLKDSVKIDDSDDLELVVNRMGQCLGVKMAEEYRVFTKEQEKIGLLSMDVAREKGDEFFEIKKVVYQVWGRVQEGQMQKERWIEQWLEITKHLAFPELEENCEYQCKSEEDCYAAICLPFRCIRSLYPEKENSFQRFRKEYFKMILFDVLVGQTDRTLNNYGIVVHKEKEFELAPLFDNANLQKPFLAWNLYSLNNMIIDKEMLCQILFQRFGQEFIELVRPMVEKYEKEEENFRYQRENWVQNEGKDILERRLEQGYGILKRFC